jgi:hypothetical protein
MPAAELAALARGYFEDVVRPKLEAAKTDDSQAADALSTGFGWVREITLLGLEGLEAEEAYVMEAVAIIARNAFEASFRRCTEGRQAAEVQPMLSVARFAALLGIDLPDVFDRLDRCLRFELDYDASFRYLPRAGSGDARSRVGTVGLELRLNDLPQFTISGRKDLERIAWSANGKPNDLCSWTGTTATQTAFEVVSLDLAVQPREITQADGSETVWDPAPPSMLVDPGRSDERAFVQCTNGTQSWSYDTENLLVYEGGWRARSQNWGLPGLYRLDGFKPSGGGDYQLLLQGSYAGYLNGEGYEETTHINLRHTPLDAD